MTFLVRFHFTGSQSTVPTDSLSDAASRLPQPKRQVSRDGGWKREGGIKGGKEGEGPREGRGGRAKRAPWNFFPRTQFPFPTRIRVITHVC